MLLEEFIEVLDHHCAGHASSVEAGLRLVRDQSLDAAILDLNLAGEASWPIADEFADKSIPFVIATGGTVGAIPPRHQGVPTLVKPYALDGLEGALKGLANES